MNKGTRCTYFDENRKPRQETPMSIATAHNSDDHTCADCGAIFTLIECEDGALTEVDNATFTTNEHGHFTTTYGYKNICEECYSAPSED